MAETQEATGGEATHDAAMETTQEATMEATEEVSENSKKTVAVFNKEDELKRMELNCCTIETYGL